MRERNIHSVGVCCLLLSLTTASGCEARDAGSSEFDRGRALLQRGELKQADEVLAKFHSSHSTHKLASRAVFLRGKAQMGLGDWKLAEQSFHDTIKKFPQSEEAHKARYKLAVAALLQGNRQTAAEQFREIVDKPNGTLVPEAKAMLRWLETSEPAPPKGVPTPEASQ